ncbi:MAG: glycosyltransferase family 2 protein [Eubacteriales bacterium]|nr:glycosyltransferase family 2 protein [Eubacteriales bacterium]
MAKENQEIKVSVIVPIYNTENYLPQCLESICTQTLKEIEIICVDDGSTDRSLALAKEAAEKDRRITVLEQENLGGGAARNKGMAIAKGEYLAFLDSDDYMERDMLEKMYHAAWKEAADISICKARRYHDDLGIYTDLPGAMREELLPDLHVFSWEDMPETIFNAFHNWPWNKLFRREFIEAEEIAFQEIHRTNDLYFTCRALMAAERITLVRECLVNYRVGTKGSCQDTNQDYPLDFYEAFRKMKAFLEKEGYYEQVEKSFVNHALDGCIANLYSQEGCADQEMLYRQLKGCLFENLGIRRQPADYYYAFNQEAYQASRIIVEQDYKTFLRYRIRQLKDERDRIIREDLARRETDLQELHSSFTWKVGRKVTAPLRLLARLFRKKS